MNPLYSGMELILKYGLVFGVVMVVYYIFSLNKKAIKVILMLICLSIGSIFIIRWRAYNCIYEYLQVHNISRNEIIEVGKRWSLLSLSSGDFVLDCKIKGKPENNIYAVYCNGIDKKVGVSINYTDGGFKENINLDKE